jgi:hypothetical protein
MYLQRWGMGDRAKVGDYDAFQLPLYLRGGVSEEGYRPPLKLRFHKNQSV